MQRNVGRPGFRVETSEGVIEATYVVAATGPFQFSVITPVIPQDSSVTQMHFNVYRNPEQLSEGAVLVVGAGSSGTQIMDELLASRKQVYLSVGPHDRPPRHYRGRDFLWWLGVLGKWDSEPEVSNAAHVTIAVSGANGGHTVDFRRLAARGTNLVGMTSSFKDGVLEFAPDLKDNIAEGDVNYLSLLGEADAYVARNDVDLPEEPDARITHPILEVNLAEAGILTFIWAIGFTADFSWLKVDAFDDQGRPKHQRGGVSRAGDLFLRLAMAFATRIVIHMGRLARRQACGGSYLYPA